MFVCVFGVVVLLIGIGFCVSVLQDCMLAIRIWLQYTYDLYVIDLEASVRRRVSHFLALLVGGGETHLGRLQNDPTVQIALRVAPRCR